MWRKSFTDNLDSKKYPFMTVHIALSDDQIHFPVEQKICNLIWKISTMIKLCSRPVINKYVTWVRKKTVNTMSPSLLIPEQICGYCGNLWVVTSIDSLLLVLFLDVGKEGSCWWEFQDSYYPIKYRCNFIYSILVILPTTLFINCDCLKA